MERVQSRGLRRGRYYVSALPFYPKEIKLKDDDNFRENKLIPDTIKENEGANGRWWSGKHAHREVKINSHSDVFVVQAAGDLPQYECQLLGTDVSFRLATDSNDAYFELTLDEVLKHHSKNNKC